MEIYYDPSLLKSGRIEPLLTRISERIVYVDNTDQASLQCLNRPKILELESLKIMERKKEIRRNPRRRRQQSRETTTTTIQTRDEHTTAERHMVMDN